jgi:hypothetical protein
VKAEKGKLHPGNGTPSEILKGGDIETTFIGHKQEDGVTYQKQI